MVTPRVQSYEVTVCQASKATPSARAIKEVSLPRTLTPIHGPNRSRSETRNWQLRLALNVKQNQLQLTNRQPPILCLRHTCPHVLRISATFPTNVA